MRSSISSSNSIERVIPSQPWGKLALCSLLITLLLTIGWESYWRSQGYKPTLNDNKDLWAIKRKEIDNDPKRTVIIGSSRILFGFDLDVWESKYNETPVQLATVGTNPSLYLDHLANESQFSGTLILGITPPLFFVPEGMPVDLPTGNIKYFKIFSPAQRISHSLGLLLDKNLAFIEQEDIPLQKMLENLPIQNRQGAQIGPKIPPYSMALDERREGQFYLRKGFEEQILNRIQQGWIPLFTPPPPPPIFTPEQFQKIFADHVNKTLGKAKSNIQKIQSRGGKVILVRYPSTEKVRELENKFAPRQAFWDRIANETGADKSFHFEDHPTLSNFTCPEWSHLSSEDATRFTEELINLL